MAFRAADTTLSPDAATDAVVCDEPGIMESRAPGPLVTVCIPTYNNAVYLKQNLLSILAQTYSKIEVLVGDNASTDETEAVVASIHDPRIKYIRHEHNLGFSGNMNALCRSASGEYVAIYHSDDIYNPRIVEAEVRFLAENREAGAVFAFDHRIDGDGHLLGTTRLPAEISPATCLGLSDLFPVLLRRKNVLFRAPTFMARAAVFGNVGYFSDRYGAATDLDMWLRIAAAFKIGFIDEPLMQYRHTRSQISSRYNYLRTDEEMFFPIMDRYFVVNDIRESVPPKAFAEYAFHRTDDETFRATNYVIRGDHAAARALLRKPFPWGTFLNGITRRKLRVIVFRLLLRAGILLGAVAALKPFLIRMEYGQLQHG